MTLEEIRTVAMACKGATEDIKWESHVCFNVGEKMFLITSPDAVPCSASFKVKEEELDEILAKTGFRKQPHLARYSWVLVDDINRMTKKEWTETIRTSYELVSQKLPKRIKKELGLISDTK